MTSRRLRPARYHIETSHRTGLNGRPPAAAAGRAGCPGRHADRGGTRTGAARGPAAAARQPAGQGVQGGTRTGAARGPGQAAARQPAGQGVQGGTRTGRRATGAARGPGPRRGSPPGRASSAARGPGGTRTGAGRGAAARRAGRPGRHADRGGRGTAVARGRIVAGAATRLLCSAARTGRATRSVVRVVRAVRDPVSLPRPWRTRRWAGRRAPGCGPGGRAQSGAARHDIGIRSRSVTGRGAGPAAGDRLSRLGCHTVPTPYQPSGAGMVRRA